MATQSADRPEREDQSLVEETAPLKGRREELLEDPLSLTNLLQSASSLLVVLILSLACVAAFSSRLFAVIRFESIIHEFDPWFVCLFVCLFTCLYVCLLVYRFNYRATHYMVNNGFYNFLNWFDDRAWYPLGRIVGGTVSPFPLVVVVVVYL